MGLRDDQSDAVAGGSHALGSLALLAGGFLVYLVIAYVLDPPHTWNACSTPSPAELEELSDQRANYVPIALPLVLAYGAWVATCAWNWAADRSADLGRPRRPSWLMIGSGIVFGLLWLFLIGTALISDEVGGQEFAGILLVLLGLALTAVVVLAVLIASAARLYRRPPQKTDFASLWIVLAWFLLLVAVPLVTLGIAAAGKEATIWC